MGARALSVTILTERRIQPRESVYAYAVVILLVCTMSSYAAAAAKGPKQSPEEVFIFLLSEFEIRTDDFFFAFEENAD